MKRLYWKRNVPDREENMMLEDLEVRKRLVCWRIARKSLWLDQSVAGSVRDWGNMREGKGKKRYSCDRCNTAKH